MRKTRFWVFAGALLLIGAAAGWYLASPWWTLRQMAAAARAHDADKLSGYIDYPALRESSKAQIKAQMTARLASESGNGFEKLGMMIGLTMVDTMIDGMLTPEGMAAMFAADKAKAGAQAQAGPAPKKPMGLDANNREIVRDGLNGFRLHEKGKAGQDGDLIFERHGLSWKLAKIQVPAQLFSAP
jgi:hypothetical protein